MPENGQRVFGNGHWVRKIARLGRAVNQDERAGLPDKTQKLGDKREKMSKIVPNTALTFENG